MSESDDESTAGGSAFEAAAQFRLYRQCLGEQMAGMLQAYRELGEREGRFTAGAAGERAVFDILSAMVDTGWAVLADRKWPGTQHANIDGLLAGPAGVFVVDVKNWRSVRIESTRLWRGDADASEEVDKVEAQASAVQALLAKEGLAPGEVLPLLVLAGRSLGPVRLGPVTVVGDRDLVTFLVRRGNRLDAQHVACVAEALDRGCPPMSSTTDLPVATVNSGPPPALFNIDDVRQALWEAAAQGPIEAWMTWLGPEQAPLTQRHWTGPARIRGAAGTGKTVVALHRAKYLAQQGRHVLFTSYVTTLSPVFRTLFTRLAPDLGDQVTFAGIHQVAVRLLRAAGQGNPHIDTTALRSCFNLAWADALRRDSPLSRLGVSNEYWRDEVRYVIKGRGITDRAEYAELRRVGRRTALQAAHRAAMWELYEQYERRRQDRGLLDWDDVLANALDVVKSGTVPIPWDAVIVDEVQDLTCTGLRLAHALVANAPDDALLMVGDGQQAVYPGGFTLIEAGIKVVGRSVVLNKNYRNRARILRHALASLGGEPFVDLDVDPSGADRLVEPTQPGGIVIEATAADSLAQEDNLLAYLDALQRDGVRLGDVAILVATNDAAEHWRDVLTKRGFTAMLLRDYDGTPRAAVKTGTFERAKALEFAHVLIPDSDTIPRPRRASESDEAFAERAALERQKLFVGMTRARDSLWLGSTSP